MRSLWGLRFLDINCSDAASAVASATMTPLNVEAPPNKLLGLVAKSLCKLSHPNIIKLLEIVEEKNKLSIIFEFCADLVHGANDKRLRAKGQGINMTHHEF